MAYKIHYNTREKKVKPLHTVRFSLLVLAFFILFAVSAQQVVPGQLDDLRRIFFADMEVDTLLQDLQDGTTISEAVSAFCQSILHGE